MVKISSDRRFTFGKYKGKLVSEVIQNDPQYIEYLCTKIAWIFTDWERQAVRNLRHRQQNKDCYSANGRCRTPFEREMYNLIQEIYGDKTRI
jgi:hypothetical protein